MLSGYREWSELSHAEDWLVFPENIGESICIDETAPSNGELYTIVSNRTSHGGKGTIIAIVKGVAADAVIEALMRIDEDKRLMVKEITMDMSNSMRLIARRCFPKAMRTIDRFHIQKLACDALQEMRIGCHSSRYGCQRRSQMFGRSIYSNCACKWGYPQAVAGSQQVSAFQISRQMDRKSETKSRGAL